VVLALERAGVAVRLDASESSAALGALRAAARLVARLVAAAGEGANVIVVSDRGDSGAHGAPSGRNGARSPAALFLASGPDVRPGGSPLVSAETIDVAPTLLYVAGARPQGGGAGRVIAEAISESLLRDRPIVPLPRAARGPDSP
jgi:hypothetical protein